MEQLSRGVIRHHRAILAVLLALSLLSGILSFPVPINADMTKYLPDDSRMRRGIDLLAEEADGLDGGFLPRILPLP